MLRNKNVHFKNIYNFGADHFFIKVISILLFMKNIIFKCKCGSNGYKIKRDNRIERPRRTQICKRSAQSESAHEAGRFCRFK